MLVVGVDVDPEFEAELNRWYDTEHIPQRLGIPGFVRARRLVSVGQAPQGGTLKPTAMPRYLALYEVEGQAVLESEAYRNLVANPSEWTIRMRDTFELRIRGIYLEILDMTAGDPAVDQFRAG